jgi:hypothetical protein
MEEGFVIHLHGQYECHPPSLPPQPERRIHQLAAQPLFTKNFTQGEEQVQLAV